MAQQEAGPPARDRHVPVLLEACVELLAVPLSRPGAVLVDGTLGLGGHSEALLEACPGARLVGIDRDPQALELAGRRLARFGDRVRLVHAVHDRIPEVLAQAGLPAADAVLLDLGVSSLQLDEPGRGFSYSVDAPLDMRMDQSADAAAGPTAADVLNTYDPRELARVLRTYGEERFARRIAEAVARERDREPFAGSARLVDLVRASVPAATRRTGGNPAKRTFQALRIEVNRELEVLEGALPAAVRLLAVGGRIVVMSFHSLEDRIVKQVLVAGSTGTTPAGLPVELPGHAPRLRLLTRGARTASDAEVDANPRAASVRLRAAERVRPDASTAPSTDPVDPVDPTALADVTDPRTDAPSRSPTDATTGAAPAGRTTGPAPTRPTTGPAPTGRPSRAWHPAARGDAA